MRALGSLLILVLAAGLLYALQKTTPSYSMITSPVVSEGTQGAQVATSAFAVKVTHIHLARELAVEASGGTKTYSSSGVWIVVEAEAEARRSTLALTFANWETPDGIRYALSQRLPSIPGYLPGERLEPGLPRPVLLAFEVPDKAIQDGRLILARTALYPLEDELVIRSATKDVAVEPLLTIRRDQGGSGWSLGPR